MRARRVRGRRPCARRRCGRTGDRGARTTPSCASRARPSAGRTSISSTARPRCRRARASATRPSASSSEVGSGVTGFAAGDRVVVAFDIACGACWFCERGQTQLCEDFRNLGAGAFGGGLPGAQAERAPGAGRRREPPARAGRRRRRGRDLRRRRPHDRLVRGLDRGDRRRGHGGRRGAGTGRVLHRAGGPRAGTTAGAGARPRPRAARPRRRSGRGADRRRRPATR